MKTIALNMTMIVSLGLPAFALAQGDQPMGPYAEDDYFIEVTTGTDTSCGLTFGGRIWCWGASDASWGRRGAGEPSTDLMKPSMVTRISQFQAASLSYYHMCGIAADRTAWCWGNGSGGKRGDGLNGAEPEFTPQPVYNLVGVTSIAAGFRSTCATTVDGSAWCWGSSFRGQRGDGTRTTIHSVPAKVLRISEVKQVAAGIDHACAIAKDDQVWCWGSNGYGQIGDGSWDFSPYGPLAEQVDVVTEARQVTVGNYHSCAVTRHDEAYCWGRGDQGQQGNGTLDEKITQARKVVGLYDVNTISAGRNHTCATRKNGEVYCWGENRYGQLGIGADDGKFPQPMKVEGLPFVVAISAGDQFTCAVDIFGRAWCWGRNFDRQVGSGEPREHVRQPALVHFPEW